MICVQYDIEVSSMCLNGKVLELSGLSDTTALLPEKVSAGNLAIAPGSCTFIVI